MAGRDYQDGCQRVALVFGTQIGATEEFAKVIFSPSPRALLDCSSV
jgi:hypothetical protein